MKILYFFLYLWVIFALLDPNPQPCFFYLLILGVEEPDDGPEAEHYQLHAAG
jgi:hypothetical protein